MTNGGANLISTNMVKQLQAINLLVTDVDNPNDCEYLAESIYAWGTGVTAGNAQKRKQQYSPYLLYLWIEPRRCPLDPADAGELATSSLCYYLRGLDPALFSDDERNIVNAVCVTWGDAQRDITDEDLAQRANIRAGAIQVVSASTIANLTLEDRVTVVQTTYAAEAKFNQTITIQTA